MRFTKALLFVLISLSACGGASDHPMAGVVVLWAPLLALGGFAYVWLTRRQVRRARERATDFIASLERQRDELVALAEKGDFDSVEKHARALLANPNAKPVHGVAHLQLSIIEDRRGDFEAMVSHLRVVSDLFARAPVPPTEADAREHRNTQELVSMNLAFALAASGKLSEAEEELRLSEKVDAKHEALKLRARAVILARRGDWETLASALAADVDDDPIIGPATKLLLRTLRKRSAAHAYRSSGKQAENAIDSTPEDEADAQRLRWVEKAVGDEVGD